MNDVRRAALTIHSLVAEDRDWLLSQVMPAQRELLGAHMGELEDLGIRPDAEVVAAALACSPDSSPAAALMRAHAESIYLIVRDEPVAFTARLLACRRWPWEAELLALFDEPFRAVLAVRRSGLAKPGPQLVRALIDGVAGRLTVQRAVTPIRPLVGRLRGLLPPWMLRPAS